MTEIHLHFLFAHYGLYGNAPGGQAAQLHPAVAQRRVECELPDVAALDGDVAHGVEDPQRRQGACAAMHDRDYTYENAMREEDGARTCGTAQWAYSSTPLGVPPANGP